MIQQVAVFKAHLEMVKNIFSDHRFLDIAAQRKRLACIHAVPPTDFTVFLHILDNCVNSSEPD